MTGPWRPWVGLQGVGSAHSTVMRSTLPPSTASYMGVGSLLSEGPCGLDVPESCPHVQGLGGKWPTCFGRGVRASPAEVQGDPEKSREARDGPRDPQGRPAGDRGQVTGVCPGCS